MKILILSILSLVSLHISSAQVEEPYRESSYSDFVTNSSVVYGHVSSDIKYFIYSIFLKTPTWFQTICQLWQSLWKLQYFYRRGRIIIFLATRNGRWIQFILHCIARWLCFNYLRSNHIEFYWNFLFWKLRYCLNSRAPRLLRIRNIHYSDSKW